MAANKHIGSDQDTSIPDQAQPRDASILGLSTNELAGISVDEIKNNKTAITMIMNYYKQLVDENNTLRNENNTFKTYMDGYSKKRTYCVVGAVLLAVSNVSIGFGTNLLTNKTTWPGLCTLIPGVVLIAAGLYFSLREP